jgi:hypothetical protein
MLRRAYHLAYRLIWWLRATTRRDHCLALRQPLTPQPSD